MKSAEHLVCTGDVAALRSSLRDGVLDEATAQAALWLTIRCAPDASLVAACTHLVVHGGASVSAADPEGRTALHLAALRGHADLVALLAALSEGMVDAVDADGRTALHVAAASADARTVHALLAAGCRRYRRDRWRRIPLDCLPPGERESLLVVEMLCVRNRSSEAISILPATRARVEARSGGTQTGREERQGGAQGCAAGDGSCDAGLGALAGALDPSASPARALGVARALFGGSGPASDAGPASPEREADGGHDAWGAARAEAGGERCGLSPRHALELAAADAGVPLPPQRAHAAGESAHLRPAAPDSTDGPRHCRHAHLASVLRAHVREQEERSAKLMRAESRARNRLFELVGLQLASAARVRRDIRKLRAKLTAARERLAAHTVGLGALGAGGAAELDGGGAVAGGWGLAGAAERAHSAAAAAFSPGVDGVESAARTPCSAPAQPGQLHDEAAPAAQDSGGLLLLGRGRARTAKARRASAPGSRSPEEAAKEEAAAEEERQRGLETNRRCLLLDLRCHDLDEREELLRGAEQRLDEQRAALARVLGMLRVHGWGELEEPATPPGARAARGRQFRIEGELAALAAGDVVRSGARSEGATPERHHGTSPLGLPVSRRQAPRAGSAARQ